MKKIGIVGAGLIGSSWSAIFASKGFEVYVYDKDIDVFKNFEERVNLYLKELKYIDEEDKITFSGEALSKYENNSCFRSTISGEHSWIKSH